MSYGTSPGLSVYPHQGDLCLRHREVSAGQEQALWLSDHVAPGGQRWLSRKGLVEGKAFQAGETTKADTGT